MILTDIIPVARQLPANDEFQLIRILAEDLVAEEDITPFERGKVYDLPTPYDSFGAADTLMEALEQEERVLEEQARGTAQAGCIDRY